MAKAIDKSTSLFSFTKNSFNEIAPSCLDAMKSLCDEIRKADEIENDVFG